MRRKVRVIFLDFDGVLNSHTFMKACARDSVWDDPSGLDPVAVARLNRVVEATEAFVVVSSTWRIGRRRVELAEILASKGFTGKVLGTTPHLSGPYQRGSEISLWLKECKLLYDVERYVVIDDDFDAGVGHAPSFVRTSMDEGLTDALADRCIEILTRVEE